MPRHEAEWLAMLIDAMPGWRVDQITPPAEIVPAGWPRCIVHAYREMAGGAYATEYRFATPAQWAVTILRTAEASA